jgi:PAS domain S-box-containing protein
MVIEGQTLVDQPPGRSDRLPVDRLPLAYILIDADGRVRDWNTAAERLFGYSKAEAIGRVCVDLIVPLPISGQLQEILRRIRSGDMQAHSINENRTKDGRLITCQWHNTPLAESDGRFAGVISLAEDITERIRVERTLEESHALLHSVIEFIPDAIYLKDRESRYLWANSVCARAMNKTVDQVLGHDDTELFAPETARDFIENDRQVMEVGATKTFHDFTTATGVTRSYLTTKAPYRGADGDILGILGNSYDVTERKIAEDELRQQKEILQSIFDHIPIMIRFVDASGRIQLVNRHWEETLGWSLEEARERDLWVEFYPDPEARRRSLEFIRESTGKWCDFKKRVRDGRVLDTRWASISVSDGTRIGIGEDVTERKQEERLWESNAARLQTLSRRLVQVQEEERLHLARELHDEIGQLLTGLRFLLKPNENAPNEVAESRFEQARSIVDEILDKVRGLSADLRPAALDHLGLVPALITLFERYSAQTRVSVNFKHHEADRRFAPEVETTAYRIVQEALTNVARHADVDQVTIRVWTTADRLNVLIDDQGRGFDPEAALSNPQTAGLAGMQERVKLLAGQLRIESRPGAGTQVTAELPLPSTSSRAHV